jgi:outer membrane receptor for ferrienterochelin and colicins
MRTTLAKCALLALPLCMVRNARAEEPGKTADDLDLVKLLNVQVSTATKTEEDLDEAPAVITVVTREEIHRFGYRNLGEVLSHCLGFFAVDDHIQPNVGVRGVMGGLGAESGGIKVMIDGRSVAYRTTSGNWLGAELVPLESVRQIEIIRGPASALYGADAFLGVVNIITVDPDEARPLRTRVFMGATGNNPSGQVEVVGTGRKGRWDFLVGSSAEYGSRSGLGMPSISPSPTIPAYAEGRTSANNLDRRSLGLQARLGYRVPDVGHLVASAYASEFSRGGDFASWAQLTNSTDTDALVTGTRIALGQARFNLDGLLHATNALDLAVSGSYFMGGVLPGDRIEVGSELWYARRRTSYRGVDSTFEARFIPSERFNVVTGVEALYDVESLPPPERIIRATEQIVPTAATGARRFDFTNVGVYASSNLWVFERWLKLTTGLRYDNHSIYGSQLTGRAGITSRVAKPLVMKLLYGSAFKAPSPYLLYASPLGPGDVVGNADLKPQKIHTVEYQLSFKPTTSFGITSGVSHSWLLDKAEFSPAGINQVARNAASQKTWTWETRADVRHYDDYSGYASFEWIHSRRDLGEVGYVAETVGDANVVYPSYIGRLGVTVGIPSPPTLPLSAGAEGMLVGPRHAADASVLAYGRPYDLDPYLTTNVFLTTRSLYLFPGHETVAALRVYNITAAQGPDPGYSGFEYPLPPREVMLELRHTY